MAAPRSPVATPSSGSRCSRSSLVTVRRRRPAVEPTKSATKSSAGWPSSSAGRPELRELAALGQHRDLVAHLHGLVDVVGDQHDGLAEFALQPEELVLQPGPDDRVDGRERLVHEQHRRVGGQRSRDTDSLLLAPGELARVPVGVQSRVEPDQVEELAARARACAFGVPINDGTVATFVEIFWWGNSPICWMTYPIRRRSWTGSSEVTSRPSRKIRPRSARSAG